MSSKRVNEDFDEDDVERLIQDLESGLGGGTSPGGNKKRRSGATGQTPTAPPSGMQLTSFSTYSNSGNGSPGRRGTGPDPGEYVDLDDDVRRVRVRGNEPILAPLPRKSLPSGPIGNAPKSARSSQLPSVPGATGASSNAAPFLPPIGEKPVSFGVDRSAAAKAIAENVAFFTRQPAKEERDVPTARRRSSTGQQPLAQEDDGESGVPGEFVESRAANFLPVMCARFLDAGGIAPHARWGHTLTAVGDDRILLFGGHEGTGSGNAVNTLFELNLRTESASSGSTGNGGTSGTFEKQPVSWEPAFIVDPGAAPPPRYFHAAASYEGRWLIVSGGTSMGRGPLGDLYSFDIVTQEWKQLWEYGGAGAAETTEALQRNASRRGSNAGGVDDKRRISMSTTDKLSSPRPNEPCPRFGHTICIRDDRLYLFGGKTTKTDDTKSQSTTAAMRTSTTLCTNDIYVFNLRTLKWKKRIRVGSTSATTAAEGTPQKRKTSVSAVLESPSKEDGAGEAEDQQPARAAGPVRRAHHAACMHNGTLFINGGEAKQGEILRDTWGYSLHQRQWILFHSGQSADAPAREKHALFGCGEAVLAIGGCSASGHGERVAMRFQNYVAVLPVVQSDNTLPPPCWAPIAMGNGGLANPTKKSFGAAFSGGFVYVLGGLSGADKPTNIVLRFLAADGVVRDSDRRAAASGSKRPSQFTDLHASMLRLRDACSCGSTGARNVDVQPRRTSVGGSSGPALVPSSSVQYQTLVQQHDIFIVSSGLGGGETNRVGAHRALLQVRAPSFLANLEQCRNMAASSQEDGRSHENDLDGGSALDALSTPAGATPSTGEKSQIPVYWTEGNSRVKGLSAPLTGEEMGHLLDYIYTGALRKDAFAGKVDAEDGDEGNAKEDVGSSGSQQTLQAVARAAAAYKLPHLVSLCEALLVECTASSDEPAESARRQTKKMYDTAERSSLTQLCQDMSSLLDTSTGASATVLFVDPYTNQSSAHALHPFILCNVSWFFSDLLKPLLTGEKQQVVKRGITAKAAGSGAGISRKRGIVVGPIPVPQMAVKPMLEYLYTQQVRIPREAAFTVMIGSHEIDAPVLQGHCESVIAREEVNYETCCTFLTLALKNNAPVLAELCLITAITGFTEVRRTAGYQQLRPEERNLIDEVSAELGSEEWRPPQQQGTEVKNADTYSTRLQNI